MGMGYQIPAPEAARDWNSGSCDVMAVALHRMYGLPIMAEFEWGGEDDRVELGYLQHAWVRLPDGRALDAAGPRAMFEPTQGGDTDDEWVKGYRIVEIPDDDPHLIDTREEVDYVRSIRNMRAPLWIMENLGPILAEMGLHPIRYLDELDRGNLPEMLDEDGITYDMDSPGP
jgi:hypothetical protein